MFIHFSQPPIMSDNYHCLISIQARDIFSIRQVLRKVFIPLFNHYSIHTYSLKYGYIVVKFDTCLSIENDYSKMITFLGNSLFGVNFATLIYECEPCFGKIKYISSNSELYVSSDVKNRAPSGFSTKNYHKWLFANSQDEYLLVWK